MRLCTFSAGLDEMKRSHQRDPVMVLRALDRCRRFSVFEATATPAIAHTMTYLCKAGLIETDHSVGYPWTAVTLTEKGRSLMTTAS